MVNGSNFLLKVIALLNELYTCFDDVIDNFDVYKVKVNSTIVLHVAPFCDNNSLIFEHQGFEDRLGK